MRRRVLRPRQAMAAMGGLGLWLVAAPAVADGWSGGVGLTSEKVYRGLGQSGGHPSLLADLRYHTDTGWAAGLGVASLDRGASAIVAEATLSLARSWQLDADWTAQVTGAQYVYRGGRRPGSYDYAELGVEASWRGRVSALLAWSPNTGGLTQGGVFRTDRALAAELTLHQPLAGRLAFDGGVGYSDLRAISGSGYAYGSAGLSWGSGPVNLYLTWNDTRGAARVRLPAGMAGSRWTATVLFAF